MSDKKKKREAQARYRARNPERIKKLYTAWRKKNKKRISLQRKLRWEKNIEYNREMQNKRRRKNRKQHNEWSRAWRQKNPEKTRLFYWKAMLYKKYGLSIEAYKAISRQQRNRCAICEQKETIKRNGKIKRLAVDHCHKSGKVRGLLCQNCNLILGVIEQRQDHITKSIKYLKTFSIMRN